MSTVEDIAAAARRLSAEDRRELIALLQREAADGRTSMATGDRRAARERFRKLAGTGHSDHTDVSTDKYRHYADVYGDKK